MARSTKIKTKIIAESSVEFSQLSPGTVPILDENKNIISSVVTPSELANLAGTTAPIQEQLNTESQALSDHEEDLENPHQTTKDQVGLGNVDNTSDLNKPISSATQTALDSKYDASNPSNFVDAAGAAASAPVQTVNNKTGNVILDKSDVGLSSVDNTSDLNKPISTATQDALDLKYDASNPAGYITLGQVPESAVTSVNGQTGDVELTKTDVGLSNVDNTSDLDKPISTATQTALNELETGLVYNQVIYVDKSNAGTYTANGNINKPYKTLTSALAAITDASASKRYAVMVAPGTYSEDPSIRLKGWIDITSFATDTVVIGTSDSSTIKWSNNSPGRVFIKDIGFSVGLETLNDNPTGTSGVVFDLDNVDTSSLIFRGRGGGRDFIQLRNDTRISGSCTIQSAATTIFDSTNIANLTMNDVGCVAPDSFGSAITASIRSNYIGSISISATNFDVYTDVWGTIIAGNLTIASNASSYPCYFNHDATSYPLGTISLSGTNPTQVVATSVAESIRYNPAISGNWSSSVPANIKDALDSLAANKASLDESGKVPSSQLPSYVDDVIEVSDFESLPEVGETGKIYITIDTNICYRWSGSTYVQITSGAVASVNGQTGIVVLTKDDVGLGNVDNTSDLNKPISTATQSALDLKYDASNPSNFVDASEAAAAAPVQSVNAQTGDVVLTKSDVGLSEVDNTSDLDKPISTAVQDALDLKYDVSNPAGYITLAQVPESSVISVNEKTGEVVLDKTDIGLSEVDNTSDEDKPISIATQAALDLKQDILDFTPEDVVNKSTDETFSGNSDTLYPSQKAVKLFVENLIAEIDLSNYETIENVDSKDAEVLQSAKDYTDTAIAGLENSGDISEMSFDIANNQTNPEDIDGFIFDETVRSFNAQVSVYLQNIKEEAEIFQITGVKSSFNGWSISIISSGDITGIQFSITTEGQMQYTSPVFNGFVAGLMKFRASVTSV
jgi:hypothetical protein